MVKELGMKLEDALPYMTSHVAEELDLLPKKGWIKEGADGDVLLFDQNMELDTFIAGGRILMKNKEILQKGTYEK